MATNNTTLADFIWKNADDLWGHFKHVEFGKIILPFTLLRRLECVLEPTREKVRETVRTMEGRAIDLDIVLPQVTGFPFYNVSEYSLSTLGATRTRQNLEDYIAKFSGNARVIFEQFDFINTLARMDRAGVLYRICQNFADIDLHPKAVPDRVMSNVYEHLIRRFGAEVNEAAEDFMTPRDVVHLAIEVLLDPDDHLFEENPGLIRTIYDPTCGTGGFLTDGMDHIDALRDRFKVAPTLVPYGQELEPETHAVALTSMLLRTLESDPGRDLSKNIKLGSTLSNDLHEGEHFHYCVSNPPFGKTWTGDQDAVVREHQEKGFEGRFGPKLPRISDGSMLFLQHIVAKFESPERGGGRGVIVLSGSPLFNGGAGSGESEIRRYLLENDTVEAIIALPTEIFFRTGIGTYLWVLSNKKPEHRQNKVQLIDATKHFSSMRKNEGNKRKQIGPDQIREIVEMYAGFEPSKESKVFDYKEFGYRRIRVLRPLRMNIHMNESGLLALKSEKAWGRLTQEQQEAWEPFITEQFGQVHDYEWAEQFCVNAQTESPEIGRVGKPFIRAFINAFGKRDPEGEIVLDKDGSPLSDTDLTDYENVPLTQDIHDYVAQEVLPHVPDAWIDLSYTDEQDGEVGIVGYEINFNRYFYEYQPPRDLHEIDAELKAVEEEIRQILDEVME